MLRFERRLRHPVQDVWRALTNPAELDLWFPAHIQMEFRVGGRMTFAFLANDIVPPPGTVTAIEPLRLFAFDWGEDGLRFEVTKAIGGCALVFTHGFSDRREAAKSAAGWHVCLDALEAVLRDELPEPPRERWGALFGEYGRAFGEGEDDVGMVGRSHHEEPR